MPSVSEETSSVNDPSRRPQDTSSSQDPNKRSQDTIVSLLDANHDASRRRSKLPAQWIGVEVGNICVI